MAKQQSWGSRATRVAYVMAVASLMLCCDKVEGLYSGYTGPCSSSQVGSVEEVYQNSGPVPKAGVPGSLCNVSVTPLPFDQKYVSTCTTVCCSTSNCNCGEVKAALVSCSGAVASTIYCWITNSPVMVSTRNACCTNFTMNPSTGICEAIATSTTSTTTTTTTTEAPQTTTAPHMVLLLTEGSRPASNDSLPSPQANTGLQGPLMYGVIGAIILLALVILLVAIIFFCCRRRRREVDDFSGLEARVKVAPAGKKVDKVKVKDEAKVADDGGKGKGKGKSNFESADDRKGSTSSQRELFYDIDDLSGEVFAVEGPLPVTDDDLAVTFAPAPHEALSRAVSNDYVTLPAPSAQIQEHNSQGQGQGQAQGQGRGPTFAVDPDPVYQSIP